jgi:hypothetical protein
LHKHLGVGFEFLENPKRECVKGVWPVETKGADAALVFARHQHG